MNDKTLRRDILDELEFEPCIDAGKIGVTVEHGVVTLTGSVNNYAQKCFAEAAVKRIKGVRAIAEELKIEAEGADPYSDDDIARRALTVIDLNVLVPLNAIMVKVERGLVTLTGEVEWQYQKTAVTDDLRKLRGVAGINNLVVVKPQVSAGDIELKIRSALQRSAGITADQIRVAVDGGKVRLEGKVETWADRQALERAVWSAPGVSAVEDNITVH